MSIRIVTDSNCDLPQAMVDEYGVTVVPMYINIGAESYLDGVTMSRQEFYEGLPYFDSHPMTSVPGPGTFIESFDKLAAEGATEILAIHISGSLSAMVNSARLAAEEWDRLPVHVHDSGNLTLGTGLQALAAARAAAEGSTSHEIMTLLQLDAAWELEYAWRRGEIGSAECLSQQWEMVRVSEGELQSLLDSIPLDEAFPTFFGRCQEAGVPLVVLSDGLDLPYPHQRANLYAVAHLDGIPPGLWPRLRERTGADPLAMTTRRYFAARRVGTAGERADIYDTVYEQAMSLQPRNCDVFEPALAILVLVDGQSL